MWSHARPNPRRLNLHQRDEAMHLRLGRRELGEDAAQSQRIFAQRRPYPICAGSRRIAFIEDQVDDLENRAEPRRKLGSARHCKGHVRRRERPLGAHDALLNRCLRHEKRARDFFRRQSTQQAERQRHARLG